MASPAQEASAASTSPEHRDNSPGAPFARTAQPESATGQRGLPRTTAGRTARNRVSQPPPTRDRSYASERTQQATASPDRGAAIQKAGQRPHARRRRRGSDPGANSGPVRSSTALSAVPATSLAHATNIPTRPPAAPLATRASRRSASTPTPVHCRQATRTGAQRARRNAGPRRPPPRSGRYASKPAATPWTAGKTSTTALGRALQAPPPAPGSARARARAAHGRPHRPERPVLSRTGS